MSKLIIKAANGSVEDFPVDAPGEWTVLELKRHLHRSYPSKPEVSFQKLVCGGKLLHDGTKITEVVSNAAGSVAPPSGDPLVVHLVVYDRSMSAPSVVPSSTSTRSAQGSSSSRNSNSSRSTLSEQEGQRAAAGVVPPPGVNEPLLGNQGLRFRMGVPPNDPNIQNLPMFMPGGGAYPYPMAPPPQFYMSPYGQMYANQFQQWYNAYYGPREGVQEQNGGGGGGAGEPHPLDLPVNGNGRNNDGPDGDDAEEINAPGGVGMMGGGAGVGGGLRQRDMVDYLYMLMMISFLIFVAYVTNSLGRLVIFTAGVVLMLLNQGGFFTLRRRRVAVHGEDVPAREPQQGPGQEGNQEQGDQVDGHENDGRSGDDTQAQEESSPDSSATDSRAHSASAQPPPTATDAPSPPPAQNVPPPAPPAPGLLNTVYVFITSFFTSLVPQQRPELELN